MQRTVSPEEIERRRSQRHATRQNQTYQSFLQDVKFATSLSKEMAEKATTSILCLLEERLQPEEAFDLESQLPKLLRQLLHRCEKHEHLAARKFHRQDMLLEISHELNDTVAMAEKWTRAVFQVLSHRLTDGEIDDVVMQLPKDIRELWPKAVQERIAEKWEKEVTSTPTTRKSPRELHSEMLATIDWVLELPMDAQLGFLRTVVPRILSPLADSDSLGFVHTLNEEIQRARKHEQVYDIRETGAYPSH